MSLRSFVVWALPVWVATLAVGGVSGQDYPNKPIRIITTAPGGSSDFTSRLMAQNLTGPLGQQVIVDNRGNVGGEILSKATPDGYTLMLDGFSLWLGPLIQKTPYDPLTFSPMTTAVQAPNVVVVNSSLPVKSIKELIALAKAKPGTLNYGSGGIGGATHLGAELFTAMAGVNIVNVNYQGTGPAINAVLANEVQMMVANATISTPHIKSGRLRALAVTSSAPSAIFPDVPTVAASLPGYESLSILLIVAPAATPRAIIDRVYQESARVLGRADVKEKLFSIGVETVASSPAEAAAKIKSELAKWGKLIKDLGLAAK